MVQITAQQRPRTADLILVAGLISLVVTIIRVVGELQYWPGFRHPASPIGVTWLVPIFGAYFAVKLANAGYSPPRVRPATLAALAGLVMLAGGLYVFGLLNSELRVALPVLWTVAALAALFSYVAWRELFWVLLAYGYAARIPVATVTWMAMRRSWGTHYDAIHPQFHDGGFWAKYLWLGFFPQLTFYVAFTIVVGTFFGVIIVSILRMLRPRPVIDFV